MLTKETEAKRLACMWICTKKRSWLGKAEYKKSKTWHVYSSENHHAMDFICHWHFAKYAKDLPAYRDLTCVDGSTLAQQYDAWNDYLVVYFRECARKGLCIEMRHDGYNSTLINGHGMAKSTQLYVAKRFVSFFVIFVAIVAKSGWVNCSCL